jgi:glycosyltransferase involved in cell wall biosynthesis
MAYSIEDYSDKLMEIENSKDLYLEMSSNTANKYFEKYSYDFVKKQIVDLYSEVMQ